MRILQACERLEIPVTFWPKCTFPQLPRELNLRLRVPDRFDIPPFCPLEESIAEWKIRCHKVLTESLDKHAELLNVTFEDAIKHGAYMKIKQTRDTTDLNLRYEWAAKRICLRTPYRKLAQGGYSADRIKQAVLQILKTAGWNKGI
jgi:hypothetical protein